MKNVTIHWNNLLGAIAALMVFFLLGQGILQKFISFAGPLNEMGCAFMSLFLSVILFSLSFSKTSK
jgi:high-affinity Fe2+/Pb2+ permease